MVARSQTFVYCFSSDDRGQPQLRELTLVFFLLYNMTVHVFGMASRSTVLVVRNWRSKYYQTIHKVYVKLYILINAHLHLQGLNNFPMGAGLRAMNAQVGRGFRPAHKRLIDPSNGKLTLINSP